jgi:hypothetical protein
MSSSSIEIPTSSTNNNQQNPPDINLDELLHEEEIFYQDLQKLETERNNSNNQCTICLQAHVKLDKKLLIDYGEQVCHECKEQRKDLFQYLSKTKAKEEYLLSDEKLASLKYKLVRNKNMKYQRYDVSLFLVKHLKQAAISTWGSLEKLQEEKQRRFIASDERKRKSISKRREEIVSKGSDNFRKEIKSLRKEILGNGNHTPEDDSDDDNNKRTNEQISMASSLYNTNNSKRAKTTTIAADRASFAHQHDLGPEVCIEDNMYQRSCTLCDYVEEFEKI